MASENSNQVQTYEGMFLFPQGAAGNLQAAVDHVMDILNKIEAEIITFSKWDERRLAYEIKGNKRGVYFLAFFKANPSRINEIERQCNLSEQILRSLVTRADYIPAEHIEAAEGRDKLADEIRVRGEQSESASRGTSSVTTAEEKAAAEAQAEKASSAATATATAEKDESGDAGDGAGDGAGGEESKD